MHNSCPKNWFSLRRNKKFHLISIIWLVTRSNTWILTDISCDSMQISFPQCGHVARGLGLWQPAISHPSLHCALHTKGAHVVLKSWFSPGQVGWGRVETDIPVTIEVITNNNNDSVKNENNDNNNVTSWGWAVPSSAQLKLGYKLAWADNSARCGWS